MPEKSSTVEEYISSLAPDRQEAIRAVYEVIKENLPEGLSEGIQYNMIGWAVPFDRYPHGYHCDPKQPLPFLSLGSQKNHMAIYLFCLYTDPAMVEQFKADYHASGKKLDMGASCVRFKKLDQLPLELIATTIGKLDISRFIELYEEGLPEAIKKKRAKHQA